MPYVTANGLRIHVQHLGEPGAPPVVMIHGMLSGSLASWYFGLAPALARSHHVVMYDQRGHGLSERPLRGYTLTELTADLEALTATLGPCAMVGHSFGGLVALRHAIDHPDRVAAVALVDSFIPSPTGGAKPDAAAGAHGPRGADSGGIDMESMRAWEQERRRSRELAGRRRRRRASGEQILLGGTTVLSDLRHDSQIDPVALAGLPIPVLCVMGSASPFRSEVEGLCRQLPPDRCRVEVLEGGHALHLDAPTQLAEVVTQFLSGNEPDHDGRAAGAASGDPPTAGVDGRGRPAAGVGGRVRPAPGVGAGDHPSGGTSAQGGRHG